MPEGRRPGGRRGAVRPRPSGASIRGTAPRRFSRRPTCRYPTDLPSLRPMPRPARRRTSSSATGWIATAITRVRRGAKSAPGAEGDAVPALSQALLDLPEDPLVVVDAEDRIQAASRAAEELFGATAEAMRGTYLSEAAFAPDHRDDYRAQFADALVLRVGDADDAAPSQEHERVVLDAEGARRKVSVEVRPLATPEGADAPWFAVRLRRPSTADAWSRTLHTVLDTLPDPVVAVGRSGRIVFRNRASVREQGPQEADGPDALTADEWAAAQAVLRSGSTTTDEATDDQGRTRQTTRTPVRDADGAVVGVVALSRDVTALRTHMARLLDDKRSAEEAARAGGEALATTSHEVRTLMSGVTGMTTLLLDTRLDADQRGFVETIRSSSASLLRVVNDVLDLSKMDAGMLELERRPLDPRAVVTDAMHAIVQQASAKELQLFTAVGDDVPAAVLGDALRLQQVLTNLLTNAVKFTDEGSVRVRLTVRRGGAPALAFAVEDTGVGIAPERLDAVFDRYVQADASTARTNGGTGLGLAICRRLVALMGGELTAGPGKQGGTVFRFAIPLVAPAAADALPAEPESVEIDAAPSASEAPPAPAPTKPATADRSDAATADAPAPPASGLPPAEPAEPELADAEPAHAELPAPEPSAAPSPARPAPAQRDASAPPPPAARPAQPVLSETLTTPMETPVEPPSEPAPLTPPGSRTLDADSMLPAMRVLLVEDDPVMQTVTGLTLRRLGYAPTVVDNGLKGVEAVRSQSFELVLMDVMMPVMNGLEATRAIREDAGPHPQPAIVALTANALEGDRQMCLDAGCDDYLSKPVSTKDLAATIENAIRRKREGAA